jgi:cytochrome c-type biogenesis protein CcmH/NrfG
MPKDASLNEDVPVQHKDAELIIIAQTALAQNSLDESMKQYTKLIKKGHLLDKIIQDLREAIYHFPADVNIWQTLGDAYMRANRIQDALDAYGKAEELLR